MPAASPSCLSDGVMWFQYSLCKSVSSAVAIHERGPPIDRVEHMGLSKRAAHGGRFDGVVVFERRDDRGDTILFKGQDEVEIVRGPRDAPEIARHRAGEHVRKTDPVEPPQAIGEELALSQPSRSFGVPAVRE